MRRYDATMFNVGGGEIIVILLLALLLLGPEKLPDMARRVGRVLADVRRMTSGFEEEMRSAMDIDLRDPLRSDAVHRTEPGPTLVGPISSSPPTDRDGPTAGGSGDDARATGVTGAGPAAGGPATFVADLSDDGTDP